MPQTGAPGASGTEQIADEPWWLEIAAQQAAAGQESVPPPANTVAYHLGDATLQVASHEPSVLVPLERLYGDCAVASGSEPGLPRVVCVARRLADSTLVSLTFLHGAPSDLAGVALSLLHPLTGGAPYAIRESPLPGWRLVGDAAQPVVAACGQTVLVDSGLVPGDFVAEYLVSATLAAQSGLLIVHAASLRIGESGVLLIGSSHTGKTTTSLHLAARGHTLMGDEIAVVRAATSEIVPFQRSVNLRPGPRAAELAAALRRARQHDSVPAAAASTELHRISELFPGAAARPVPLSAAFFLRGFAAEPAIAPLALTVRDLDTFDALTSEIAYAAWGLAPDRRALRLLALHRTLARGGTWELTVGGPGATAALIERTLETLPR